MVDDLLSKAGSLLIEHCARLGVISKVASLAGSSEPPTEEFSQNKVRISLLDLNECKLKVLKSF